MAAAERISDFELTKDTPYLALTGEIWNVIVRISEKISRFITALHWITFICDWVLDDYYIPEFFERCNYSSIP